MGRIQKFLRKNKYVSADQYMIHKDMLGVELASFRRRSAAMFLDLFFLSLIAIPLGLFIVYLSLMIQSPKLIERLKTIGTEQYTEDSSKDVTWEVMRIINKHHPNSIPLDLKYALNNQNIDLLDSLMDEWTTTFHLDQNEAVIFNYEIKQLDLGPTAFVGKYSTVISQATIVLAWFTLWTWLWKGRTPGKKIFGIKIIKLDSTPMNLWDSFGRAGGYSASLSTLAIGFFESIWNPNRQTLHDKISETVVIRVRRKSKKTNSSEEPTPHST